MDCEVDACTEGRTRASDGVNCCWPGQLYTSGQCRGIPECPSRHRVEGETCVRLPPESEVRLGPLPPGAVVLLDDRPVDPSSGQLAHVPAGTHILTIDAPDYRSGAWQFEVGDAQLVSITPELERIERSVRIEVVGQGVSVPAVVQSSTRRWDCDAPAAQGRPCRVRHLPAGELSILSTGPAIETSRVSLDPGTDAGRLHAWVRFVHREPALQTPSLALSIIGFSSAVIFGVLAAAVPCANLDQPAATGGFQPVACGGFVAASVIGGIVAVGAGAAFLYQARLPRWSTSTGHASEQEVRSW